VILAGRAVFLALLAIALAAIVRAAVRRDPVLGRLVTAASIIYVAGALLMGVYLQSFRGRNYLAPDEVAFQQQGALIAQGWISGTRHVPTVSGGYPYWNAIVILFWGPSPVPLRLANAVMGVAGVFFAFVLGQQLFKDLLTARLAAVLVMASPSLMVWGAQNLKERPLGTLVTLALIGAVAVTSRWGIARAALFAASLVLLGAMRHYYAAIIGWIALAAVAAWPGVDLRNRALRVVALTVLVGFALQIVTGTFLASGMRYETIMRYVRTGEPSPGTMGTGTVTGYRVGETAGRPELATDRTAGGWIRAAAFVLFGRFESEGGAGRVMALALMPEWLLSFVLVPLVIVAVYDGVWHGRPFILIPGAFLGALVLLLTYIYSEPWTTIRFRSVYWPVFLILAAGGLTAFARRRHPAAALEAGDQPSECADWQLR
jgi:hypothetical protein